MKKLSLFLLTLCMVLSVCIGCADKNTNMLNTSNESILNQEDDATGNALGNDETSSETGDDGSENTETTFGPASSQADERGSEQSETTFISAPSADVVLNFSKKEAMAYFASEYDFEQFTDFTPVTETALIPFSELEKWLDGTSDLKTPNCLDGEKDSEKVSIYEMFDSELFHKPFTKTDFYTIRFVGRSMNVTYNVVECSKPVSDDWTEEGGGVFYIIRYDLEGVKACMYVSHLSEYNKYYQATLGNISDYYRATDREFNAENIRTVKMYDQMANQYIDAEIYVDEMNGNGIKYIQFIFCRYLFRIEFHEADKVINFDNLLDNIIIMDLLQAYDKVK